jgi:coatomer subunit beta
MRQSWQASKAVQMLKKAEEQLEKERVMRILKKVLICRSCMEHCHSYVRKNAVFAVYAIIYREFENLILNAPELLQTFLAAESDVT